MRQLDVAEATGSFQQKLTQYQKFKLLVTHELEKNPQQQISFSILEQLDIRLAVSYLQPIDQQVSGA
ncbi:MAG: hypothetical protein IJU79_05475 [Desulfovibrionaceae bacterium]|nr:hypothetical protein [Desulfovibrionaceae bacterium]